MQGATKDGTRCFFGEPHAWALGFYRDGQWMDGWAKCYRCGKEEFDG